MILPIPSSAYSKDDQSSLRREIARADQQNRKIRQDIEVTSERIILRSPNGSRFALMVADDGTLSTNAV